MKTSLLYGFVSDSGTRVRCIFCGVGIPKSNKCMEEHANGAKHKENIELIEENGISFVDDDHLYCKLCKTTLNDDESVSKHIEADDHANWMAAVEDLIDGELINIENYLSSDKDKEDCFCEACQCTLPCTLTSIQDHVNSYNHRAKAIDILKPMNGIIAVDNSEEVWCKICDVYIENTVQRIFDHIDNNENHLDWITYFDDILAVHDISIQDYLTSEHEDNAFCAKCQIQIPCNLQSLEDHIISETHLNSFNSSALDSN